MSRQGRKIIEQELHALNPMNEEFCHVPCENFEEYRRVTQLWQILGPCLRYGPDGRFQTKIGDKTLLGLARTITRIVEGKPYPHGFSYLSSE